MYFLKNKYTPLKLKGLFVALAVGINFNAMAQVFYSTNKFYIRHKTEQNNLVSHYTYPGQDTGITKLSQFASRNFSGNTGLPSPNYLMRYGSGELQFRLYQAPSVIDRFTASQVEYNRTKGPYAQLTGIAGDKQLQIFRLFYTQSYKEKLNITLRFNRYTSLGYYLKQQTYTNNFYASSNYATSNKRVGYYFYALNNGNKNQENGGIKNVVLTDSTSALNKDLLAIRLSSASRDNREFEIMLNPWLRLNKRADSLGGLDHYLQLKSRLNNGSYKYKDLAIKKDKFYTNFYFDANTTNDSTHTRQYLNELDYTLKNGRNSFALSVGYRHEINRVWQKRDSLFIQHLANAELFFGNGKKDAEDSLPDGSFKNHMSLQYVLEGPNKGNYRMENSTRYWMGPGFKNNLYFNALAESRSADFQYNNWNSNHFQWFNNGYKTQESVQLKAGLCLGNTLELSAMYHNLFKYLYFDEYALPRQYDKTIENLALSLDFEKVFLKHLGVSFNHVFQSSSRPVYIRMPRHITTARLYYNGNLFRNNLQLQVGSQVQVYQAFTAYNYMPATQAFYLQELYTTAACPFVDIYLNARIRPVTIFLKVENALYGLVGNNYSFVPGYYQTDRAFRFGISWVFFD